MALTAQRNTRARADVQRAPNNWGVKASAIIFKGSLVVLDAGYAKPGAAAGSLVCAGRACDNVVATGLADGAKTIDVEEGIFKWGNNAAGSDPVVAADVGGTCYVEDDYNVCHTSSSKSAAGRVMALDTDGVWVKTVIA